MRIDVDTDGRTEVTGCKIPQRAHIQPVPSELQRISPEATSLITIKRTPDIVKGSQIKAEGKDFLVCRVRRSPASDLFDQIFCKEAGV